MLLEPFVLDLALALASSIEKAVKEG
jgi:hypothetical protein